MEAKLLMPFINEKDCIHTQLGFDNSFLNVSTIKTRSSFLFLRFWFLPFPVAVEASSCNNLTQEFKMFITAAETYSFGFSHPGSELRHVSVLHKCIGEREPNILNRYWRYRWMAGAGAGRKVPAAVAARGSSCMDEQR